jgi:hypothetical protein
MAKKLGVPPAVRTLSRNSLFGPPPVLKTEDAGSYERLLTRVSKDQKPNDIFEEIWIRDAVDNSWEALRWRRLLTNLLESNRLEDIIDSIERLDRLAMTAEARRNAALHEINRHRISCEQNRRQEPQEAEDVEFTLVDVVKPKDQQEKGV